MWLYVHTKNSKKGDRELMLREAFGTDKQGKEVEVITLTNANGTEAKIATLGAKSTLSPISTFATSRIVQL